MNASELVARVSGVTGLSRREVRLVLETVLAEITAELGARRRVTLSKFGAFDVQRRAARTGTHPRTGQAIALPDRDAVVFRCGTELRQVLLDVESDS